jgi:hypothetical protein
VKPEDFPEIEKLKSRAMFARLQAAKKAVKGARTPAQEEQIERLSRELVKHALDLFRQ